MSLRSVKRPCQTVKVHGLARRREASEHLIDTEQVGMLSRSGSGFQSTMARRIGISRRASEDGHPRLSVHG